MTITQRNKKIRELRDKGRTYKEISEYAGVNISPERIRQICGEKISKTFLYSEISRAYNDNILTKADFEWLRKEIARLSKHDRQKGTVIQRRQLVKFLYDKMKFSFPQIATLLNRHHTTIMSLYHG